MFRKLRDGSGRRGASRVREIVVAPRGAQRNRDAGNAEQCALERARDGSRVRHIVTQVPSFVDSGHDEIRQRAEYLGYGHVHTVRWRAVDGTGLFIDAFEPEGMPQRQRVADRARFSDRRYDGDVAAGAKRLRKLTNAVG